jgi:uncharacterized protein YlxW (UPF0749 family)
VPTRRKLGVVLRRVRRVMLRARGAQRRRNRERTPLGRTLTALVCAVAGLMVIVSALNAQGIDLRPGRNTDLVSLVQEQSRRNIDLSRQVTALRQQVDELTALRNDQDDVAPAVAKQAEAAGFRAVSGPAVTVTLDDAPASVVADGQDADLLVVHQQDIQAVVNALWSGGAEAMAIQGQRVIATTGIKCVGNTVVLHGIPYAPPYVISAIGNQERLRNALATSEPVKIYNQYVAAYGLVYQERSQPRVEFPAHEGALELQYASVYGAQSSTTGTPR